MNQFVRIAGLIFTGGVVFLTFAGSLSNRDRLDAMDRSQQAYGTTDKEVRGHSHLNRHTHHQDDLADDYYNGVMDRRPGKFRTQANFTAGWSSSGKPEPFVYDRYLSGIGGWY